jgi:O-antigen/teichoic acid export membrane protein
VNLGVGLIVSPVLLAALGVQRYGLWSLLWAITGSLGLLDLRTAAALTPLAATAWAREERDRVVRLVTTGLTFYAALGILEVGAVLLWTRVPGLMAWLPGPLREEGTFALIAAAAVFAINSVTLVFTSLLHAFQRFDLAARIAMAVTAFRGTVLVAVAWGGGGLRELVLAEACVACLQWLVTLRVVRRLLPDTRLLRRPDPGAFRELIRFGGKLQIAHITHLISLHADKILLSAFLGMRGLPLLLISATMPVVSAMDARGDRERLWEFYLKCMRMVVFAATPLLVFTVTGAREILITWVGVAALEARQAVWLLASGYYLYLVSVMANYVSVGMRKPELEMRRSMLSGALNLGLSAALIPLIGFAGAPLGTTLALAAGSFYLIRAVNVEFGRSPSAVLGMFRRPALVGIPAAGGAVLIFSTAAGSGSSAVVGLVGSALLIGTVFLWLGIRDEILAWEWLRSVPARLKPPAAKL